MTRHLEERIGVLAGLRAFAGGMGFIFSTPSVWGYALVPTVMVLVLMCGLGGLGIWGAARASDVLLSVENGMWAHVGNWLLTVLFSIVALVLAALLAIGFAQPFSSFALFAIVQAQEQRLTGYRVVRAASADVWMRGVWVTLVMIFLSVPLFLGLFLISLFFPPAALVTVPLKFLLCGWLLAWNFLDYPLGERGLGAGASLSWMGRHLGAVTAFGAAWALLVIVPGIVLVLLPMGVAGAARLVVEAEGAAAIDPDL